MDATGDMLRATAERVFALHATAAALREAESGAWPQAAWDAVAEAGLAQALLPESAGGFGIAVPDALSLLRTAGGHALPLPLAETMLATWLLPLAGLAVPEGPLTVATGPSLARHGEVWRIEGPAARVPWGRHAAHGVFLAEVGGRMHAALVPAAAWQAAPGENLAREPRDDLRLAHDLPADAVAPIDLDATRIQALGAAIRVQQIAGALARVTAMTAQYAQDRVQFGRPIGKFQAVQQNLAVLAGQAAAASAAADLAAEAFATARVLPIAAAKARAGEAAGIAAGIAHQVHGAIGFTYEHSLHFLTKRLWSWRDEYGNEALWSDRLGRHMLRAGADGLWAALTEA
jgi:acyl-CoA dehydrogenase